MEPMEPPSSKTLNISSARRGLRRGLDALLPAAPAPPSAPATDAVIQIGISAIYPNPHQPRQHFHPERLKELAESIKVHGIVQPVVVKRQGDRYLLIAGERRWRAASLAGIPTVPAILKEVPDNQILELTLIENIQREELNPLEVAEAFMRLAADANLTHEQIAERTGKDRLSVTNHLRLLKLTKEVQNWVASGELSMGHAKVLMGLASEAAQKALAARIVAQGLSVRQTEVLARAGPRKIATAKNNEVQVLRDPNVVAAVREIERTLGARVRLVGNDIRGRIVIEYHSSEDLDRIYALLVGRK
jgi:ParB family transcriptional regulator, chromosome partitioning protein